MNTTVIQPQQGAPAVQSTESASEVLPGPKIILVGEYGTGKTHMIRTLIDAGFEVAAIFVEPGMEVVSNISCAQGMHYVYIAPAEISWDLLKKGATLLKNLSFEDLTKLPGPDRAQFTQVFDLYNACANFTCQRCGKVLGPIDKLDPARYAVSLDSLSGITQMFKYLVVGSKPLVAKNEYGPIQENILRFTDKLAVDTQCTVVMTAHLEREPNEVTGAQTLNVATIGQKLAPRIPKYWSDVIHCIRNGDKVTWSTITPNMVLKARNLPWADNIKPDLVPLIQSWRARGGATRVDNSA